MELKYASGKHLERGWTLSYDLLVSIQKKMEEKFSVDEIPSLEQIEGTLITFNMLSAKKIKC
ncbi:hypothetical protein ABES74_22035 [Bacillus subtilis]|uniref:Uncharacterized protein n=2 Tax=Bacillus TaxID=1386 RepID=A0AAP1EDC0_BACIU|nr:hypothetical protein [Bacillus subtilis]AYK67813.1 hypothetical protein D9C11_21800 [Bacillus subtilis subsp. subtilis]KIN53232.1 hypothetical protein B4146_2156 [Bacillus subtilis]KZD95355.1 hypothetical protein B4122_0327 [Bacillus subtilis]CAF1823154.1 hypothetical protein NRS6085_04212 [Bacillus subtilis]CAI6273978.1 hypothetical protein NRS6085_11285 [Bacillus subtilis]